MYFQLKLSGSCLYFGWLLALRCVFGHHWNEYGCIQQKLDGKKRWQSFNVWVRKERRDMERDRDKDRWLEFVSMTNNLLSNDSLISSDTRNMANISLFIGYENNLELGMERARKSMMKWNQAPKLIAMFETFVFRISLFWKLFIM